MVQVIAGEISAIPEVLGWTYSGVHVSPAGLTARVQLGVSQRLGRDLFDLYRDIEDRVTEPMRAFKVTRRYRAVHIPT